MKTTKECRAEIYTFIKENIGQLDGENMSNISDLLKEYAKTVTEIRDREKLDLSQKIEELKKIITDLKNKLEKRFEINPSILSKPEYKMKNNKPYFNHDFLNKG